jgi:germination protein M
MLKKNAYNRIILSFLAFLILLIVYLFPKTTNNNIKEEINYIDNKTEPIYLIDNNNYVSRVSILKNNNDNIKSIINLLTINNEENILLPYGFKAVLPENTKLLDYSLEKGLLKLNFSKEFLNMELGSEEKVLSSLIYSLTELNNVDKLMIFIEGNKLTKIPNTNKILDNTLDRDFGINKTYDLTSLKDIQKTTTYYLAKEDNISYFIPITEISNNNEEKVEIIIKNLKTSPINQTNLMSYLASSTSLDNYEILEQSINLSFNNSLITNINDNAILEEVKYSIYLSLRDSYNIKAVVFEIPNKAISSIDN